MSMRHDPGQQQQVSPRLIAKGAPPLADHAYTQLREALMEGIYEPGQPLVLQSIASQLGVSVMPIRDAVMRLAAEGALELYASRSARVPMLNGERFMELCDVRMLLEGRAAELAASRVSDEEVREIEGLHAEMRKATRTLQVDLALRCNREFHFAIYRAAHHSLLSQMIEKLWLQCGPHFRAVFSSRVSPEGRRRGSLRHHDEAVDAIRKRDPRQSSAAIVHDIQESAAWYRAAHAESADAETSPYLPPAKAAVRQRRSKRALNARAPK